MTKFLKIYMELKSSITNFLNAYSVFNYFEVKND